MLAENNEDDVYKLLWNDSQVILLSEKSEV